MAPTSAFESETFGQDVHFRLEQPVGSMSISPSGRDVVLASREGLHIIDLDQPYSPPRYLQHRTPWEVADVQWSPFASRDYWVVSTSNQKALVWNLAAKSWQDSIEYVLHGHTRAITDINFSAHNPDILATCAVDSFVHCWDLRAPLRPANTFSDWFAGATQVKWSRQNEHVIASSHDKFLHIWDDRKGAYPLRTIKAHDTKIYGVDWNRWQGNKLVTCSLDRKIKFWNLDNEGDNPERVIETAFPVWRARHTPFGYGLLVMPQRGNNDLHLYDRRAVNGVYENGPVRPVATFSGHDGQVKEFLWRARGAPQGEIDQRDFQLVSWGTDRELRLHAMDPDVHLDIGYEKGVSRVQRLNFTRKGAAYRTFREPPADLESPVEQLSPRDVFSRQSQFTQYHNRTSTNVGMNKVPATQFRAWAQGVRQNQRSGMHGRNNKTQMTDPMAWLKNVRINSWDSDTIAEEIRQVGDKFKKVDFETVDIARRKAVMSLQAPWGDDQSPIYLRIEMRFPKLYPRNANAILTLQKTGSVDDATHKLLSGDLQTISETYASRKRGCLEAILRYLLRELKLDQIVAWVLGESITDSKVIDNSTILADESSSDDDDQIEGSGSRLDTSANLRVPIAKGCGAYWSETGKLVCFFPTKPKEPVSFLSSLGMRDLNASESGRLFEGFGRLHTSSPARKGTNETRTADGDSTSETSDSSQDSSSSSSTSFEPEHDVRGNSSYRAGMSRLHQNLRSPDQSNQSTSGGQKLVEAPQTSVVSIHDLKDILPCKQELALDYEIFGNSQEVCKHNADVARKASHEDLACVWALVGLVVQDAVPLEVISELSHTTVNDITIIARSLHRSNKANHTVEMHATATGQTRWGNHPLGSMYLLPALFDHFERLGDFQMLAMMACVFQAAQSGGILPGETIFQSSNHNSVQHQSGHVDYFPSKAVAKAFFRNEVVPEGFVLVESVSAMQKPTGRRSGPSAAVSHSQRRAMTAHPEALARQDSQLSTRALSTIGDDPNDNSPLSTTVSLSTSPQDSRGVHRSGTGVPYSSARASLSALTQSYSGSPPNHGMGSAIASNIKKYSPSGSLAPGWVSTSIFGSQAGNKSSRKSQDGRETSMRTSLTSWNIRRPRRNPRADERNVRSAAASDVSEQTQRKKPKRRKVKTRLFNQDKFDLDGYPSSSLIDTVLEARCRAYRASYAQQLDVWQLHVQRAEILKFDGQDSYGSIAATNLPPSITPQRNEDDPKSRVLDRPRRQTLKSLQDTSPGLDIKRCCSRCAEPLDPIEKNGIPIGWQCINTSCTSNSSLKPPKNSLCAICNSMIRSLAVPCLQCGHMTCFRCAQGWFGTQQMSKHKVLSRKHSRTSPPCSPKLEDQSNEEAIIDDDDDDDDDTATIVNDEQTCPTGCGCSCATLTTIDVPYPPARISDPDIDSSPATNSALLLPPPSSSIRPLSRNNSGIHRSASVVEYHDIHTATSDPASSSMTALMALAAAQAQTQAHPRGHQRSKSITGPSSTAPTTATARSKASSISTSRSTSSQAGDDEAIIIDDSDIETDTGTGTDTDTGSAAQHAATDDDIRLNPWSASKFATLGRGIGAGLSRGLVSKASDATIRKGR